MSDGFLRRWSARKLDAQQGKPPVPVPQESVEPASPAAACAQPDPPGVAQPAVVNEGGAASADAGTENIAAVPPAPTLEDVNSLTAQSDFSRFARHDVAPEVKNAALKKLFSDPRYNVMDGLDVYVDDYSQPDPLPAPMLRQLAGAAFLRLFDDDTAKEEQAAAQPRDVADNPAPETVSQSGTVSAAVPEPTDANTDLRLQQDDAAAGASSRPGAA